MRLVLISDTHGRHTELQLPQGDMLIHAGDFSRHGKPQEIRAFNTWLSGLPYRYKVVISGNHDFLFETSPQEARALLTAAIYLEDSGIEIEGIKIWGSPVTPRFFNWAFNRSRGQEIQRHWAQIPENTDLLLVHGPPAGILDRTWLGQSVGCADLRQTVQRIRPRVVVFGHIHESYGECLQDSILYLNVSSLDRYGRPLNAPRVLQWPTLTLS